MTRTAALSGVAGRYATALFELAQEQNALDAVAQDVETLQAALEQSEDLARMVVSPLFTRDEQGRAMAAVSDHLGLSGLSKKFLGLMARNRRLFTLGDALAGFRTLLADLRGEVAADVMSAQALSEDQLAALRTKLNDMMGRDVQMSQSVDPSLLGGLVVKVGSRMIDNSIKTKLQNLQTVMKGVG